MVDGAGMSDFCQTNSRTSDTVASRARHPRAGANLVDERTRHRAGRTHGASWPRTTVLAILGPLMRRTRCVALATSAAVAVLGTASVAHSGTSTQEIFPLSKVRRGQTGYGLTTMQGTTPDRFEFEVLGVNHNFIA